MKKLLFTLSMVVYLALFSLISYVLTITCLEYKTSTSLWFMAFYYLIFGAYVINFIRNSIKNVKAQFNSLKYSIYDGKEVNDVITLNSNNDSFIKYNLTAIKE